MGRGRLVREDQNKKSYPVSLLDAMAGRGAGWDVQGVAAGKPRPSVQTSGGRSQPVWLEYVCCAVKTVH